MGEEDLGILLAKMPEMAKAVNAFTSDAVQSEAFRELVDALRGEAPTGRSRADRGTPFHEGDGNVPAEKPRSSRATKRTTGASGEDGGKRTRRARAAAPRMLHDVDLAPKGKESFTAFVAEKQPKSINEKCLVAVYYLEQIAGIKGITASHVFTCFRSAPGWKLPSDFDNALQTTKSRKSWIDTSNMEDIKTFPVGVNYVEHELPHKSKK
jgi:hypothetical protein